MQTPHVPGFVLIVAFFGGLVVFFLGLMIYYSRRDEGFQIEMRNYSMGGVFGRYTVSRPLVFFAAALISLALFAGAVSRVLPMSSTGVAEDRDDHGAAGVGSAKKDSNAGGGMKDDPAMQTNSGQPRVPDKPDGKGGR